MENFIYTKKNAISSELCNSFIENYKNDEQLKKPGQVGQGEVHSSKKSTDISFNASWKAHPQWGPLLKELMPIIKENLNQYYLNYMIINEVIDEAIPTITHTWVDRLVPLPIFNLQHYKPGEGFYSWHSERANNSKGSERVLAWMFYLNDVDMGGGTEFYHFKHTEKAEQGKMVIFSSEWMHVHRGVTAPFEDKYILTGWVGFEPEQQW
jgi:hypothetical protein